MSTFPPPVPKKGLSTGAKIGLAGAGAVVLLGVIAYSSNQPDEPVERTERSQAVLIAEIVWNETSAEDRANLCEALDTMPESAIRANLELDDPEAEDAIILVMKENCP